MVNVIVPHVSRALHSLNLIRAITSACDIGMIVFREERPVYMNEEAKRALNGRPVASVPDPGLSGDPIFFQGEKGTYRVRVISQRGIGKTILLQPLPASSDFHRRMEQFALTRRQKEIALFILRGFSNREIADRLFISEQTVKDHLHGIYEKVDVRSRSEFIVKVLEVPLR